jgi:hypothetical protein
MFKVDELHPHEETLQPIVNKLMERIKQDQVIKHPIIVDKHTLTILDGTHRLAALKKLNCKWIPACLVNYKSPKIRVSSWYRTITNLKQECGLPKILRQLQLKVIATTQKEAEETVRSGNAPASVITRQKGFIIKSKLMTLRNRYNLVRRLEEAAIDAGATINYNTPDDAKAFLKKGIAEAIIVVPKVSKEEVITAALNKRVFARKATRHIIPARPLNLAIALSILKNRTLAQVREKLTKLLHEKHLKHLPAGSTVGGRTYEEEVYLFEEASSKD